MNIPRVEGGSTWKTIWYEKRSYLWS